MGNIRSSYYGRAIPIPFTEAHFFVGWKMDDWGLGISGLPFTVDLQFGPFFAELVEDHDAI